MLKSNRLDDFLLDITMEVLDLTLCTSRNTCSAHRKQGNMVSSRKARIIGTPPQDHQAWLIMMTLLSHLASWGSRDIPTIIANVFLWMVLLGKEKEKKRDIL